MKFLERELERWKKAFYKLVCECQCGCGSACGECSNTCPVTAIKLYADTFCCNWENAVYIKEVDECCDASRAWLNFIEPCCQELSAPLLKMVPMCCTNNTASLKLLDYCCENIVKLNLFQNCCENYSLALTNVDPCCNLSPDPVGDCLNALKFVVAYRQHLPDDITDPLYPPCDIDHNCNRAIFDLVMTTKIASDTTKVIVLGQITLNNKGGIHDSQNTFPTYPAYNNSTARDRYNEVTLDSVQIDAIKAEYALGAVIGFELVCACTTSTCATASCHEDFSWLQIFKNNTRIYNGCPVGNVLTGFDPCS